MDSHHLLLAGLPAHPIPAVRFGSGQGICSATRPILVGVRLHSMTSPAGRLIRPSSARCSSDCGTAPLANLLHSNQHQGEDHATNCTAAVGSGPGTHRSAGKLENPHGISAEFAADHGTPARSPARL